jgi:hypothetical protein
LQGRLEQNTRPQSVTSDGAAYNGRMVRKTLGIIRRIKGKKEISRPCDVVARRTDRENSEIRIGRAEVCQRLKGNNTASTTHSGK